MRAMRTVARARPHIYDKYVCRSVKIDEDVSLTVCPESRLISPSSSEGFPVSGPQERAQTHHALLWTRASASVFDEASSKRRLNTIVVTSIEQYIFVQKYFCLIVPVRYNISIFQRDTRF